MRLSARIQVWLTWWALLWGLVYSLTFALLLHMLPPPDASRSAEQVAAWYAEHATSIRIGATISSWVGAFLVPFFVVVAMQIHRQERGRLPVLSTLAALGGATMALFLVLPPICWGVAAFSPERPAEITLLIHQLGVLTFVTTDQFYIFSWVAVIVTCLLPQVSPHSPFPRWFGYYSIFVALVFETGALAFNFKDGPFSWNGIVPFWLPILTFAAWMPVITWLLLTNLARQRDDDAVIATLEEANTAG